jgi:predicted carbohydrate-binding protein with CBM5 and CBM33 domain
MAMVSRNGFSAGDQAIEAVFAVLRDEGEPRCIIAARAHGYMPVTVGHALRALVQQGRATFDGPDCRRLYRRADPLSQPAQHPRRGVADGDEAGRGAGRGALPVPSSHWATCPVVGDDVTLTNREARRHGQ